MYDWPLGLSGEIGNRSGLNLALEEKRLRAGNASLTARKAASRSLLLSRISPEVAQLIKPSKRTRAKPAIF